MARVRNIERLLKIYRYIETNPGCTRWRISHALGLGATNIETYLASMESVGMYLSEDGGNRLYPFAYCPGNVTCQSSGLV